ncbi:MAG TPA: hypothetical protein VHT22_02550, partial [Casimicrobiaceae bacterium]|nr:hypothetical protein [Casimicrobiaceae bacterium]
MLTSPTRGTALRCLAFIAAGVFAVALRAEPTDADFLAARAAFLAGDAATLDRIAPRANGHMLEPYVAYWQLRLKLDEATPERVRSFLERNDGTPLADTLRGEWLKALGKRALWSEFAAEYPKRNG